MKKMGEGSRGREEVASLDLSGIVAGAALHMDNVGTGVDLVVLLGRGRLDGVGGREDDVELLEL